MNQLGIGLFQGLDVHNAPLRFLRGFHGSHVQLLGVLLQQRVGDIRHLPLGLSRLGGVGDAQRQNHLVFPQRDGIDQSGLDFFHHHIVVILNHADLGRGLDGDGSCQLQIVNLLFKPQALFRQIPGGLSVLGKARPLGGFLQLAQLGGAYLLQLLLARQNVHGQLLEIGKVLLVHLVQNRRILHKPHLMLLQRVADLFHVGLRLGIAGLHCLQLIRLLAEEAEQALFLLLVKALQLPHHAGDQVAHFPQILRADVCQGGIGEIRHFLLGARAVLQNLRGILHVNFRGEVVHDFLLLRGQCSLRLSLLHGGLLRHCQLRGVVQVRFQRQAGNCFFVPLCAHSQISRFFSFESSSSVRPSWAKRVFSTEISLDTSMAVS